MDQVPALFGMGEGEEAAGMSAGGIVSSIVSGVVGPLVSAGVDIYKTREESKTSKRELQQRAAEAAQAQDLALKQLRVMERQQVLATVQAARASQARQATLSRYAPYLMLAAGLGVLGLVASSVSRRRRAS